MVKILFVCEGNIGRSQMAEAFYNYFTNSKDASSAGTNPKTPKRFLKIPEKICLIMTEENISMNNHKVKLITKQYIKDADKIIIMCEKEYCPEFLINSNKVIYWNIKDPHHVKIENLRKIKNQIKQKYH